MKWFKKSGHTLRKPALLNAAGSKIAPYIMHIQLRIVGVLQVADKRLSLVQKKWGLFIFCLLFGGYFIYLLYSAILSPAIAYTSAAHNKGSPLIPGNRIDGTQVPRKQ